MKDTNTKRYMQEEIESLKKCNPRQFYRRLKEIGSRLDECEAPTFSIPDFVEQNISHKEAAENIASHFSSISREYPPLDVQTLPERVKKKIFEKDAMKNAPKIEEHEVYEKFENRKNKVTCVPEICLVS